jgi:hypothetical protein
VLRVSLAAANHTSNSPSQMRRRIAAFLRFYCPPQKYLRDTIRNSRRQPLCYYMCVLILLYVSSYCCMCSGCSMCGLILLRVSTYCCVLILLCPHAAICVLILLCVLTIYVSSKSLVRSCEHCFFFCQSRKIKRHQPLRGSSAQLTTLVYR